MFGRTTVLTTTTPRRAGPVAALALLAGAALAAVPAVASTHAQAGPSI